jgi:uncharacterized membrane protein
MRSEVFEINISAPPSRVWQLVEDVESWPQWSPTMTDIKRLDSGPFGPGSRAKVKQPGMPTLVWQVTDLAEGAEFTWVTRSPGIATSACHQVSEIAGGTRLTLTLTWSGPFSGLVSALAGKRTRQALAQEATGAKSRSEAAA